MNKLEFSLKFALLGRMQGNPYNSTEPGLGPLMRDVKNKICQDCELIALLEDDTGMELLVCNKIMSLDLPVRDVYRKVWLTENSEQEPMRIVYRMRGLLGDATEEFIERFDDKQQRPANDEETYRMANVMGECNGLDVLLERLSCVRDIHGEGRPLLGALVKLLSFCVKVQTNRALLISPELDAVQRLLVALKLCLEVNSNFSFFFSCGE
jgi:E3 ubiquitin-protein ligase UBR4